MSVCRLTLQHTIRLAGRAPTDANQTKIEKDRQDLRSYFLTLEQLQRAAKIEDNHLSATTFAQTLRREFENEDDDSDAGSSDAEDSFPSSNESQSIAVEDLPIPLPRAGYLANVELGIRRIQAEQQLNRLRELIADRSFQFSHVIRKAPRKGVRTRARTTTNDLAKDVSLHARMYSRCRSRLQALGCDEETLRTFKILTKDDLKASTAIINANLPGSTSLRLSWIWQQRKINAGALWDTDVIPETDADAGSILECA